MQYQGPADLYSHACGSTIANQADSHLSSRAQQCCDVYRRVSAGAPQRSPSLRMLLVPLTGVVAQTAPTFCNPLPRSTSWTSSPARTPPPARPTAPTPQQTVSAAAAPAGCASLAGSRASSWHSPNQLPRAPPQLAGGQLAAQSCGSACACARPSHCGACMMHDVWCSQTACTCSALAANRRGLPVPGRFSGRPASRSHHHLRSGPLLY